MPNSLALPRVAVGRKTPPKLRAVSPGWPLAVAVAITVCRMPITAATAQPASRLRMSARASPAPVSECAVSQNSKAYVAMVSRPSKRVYVPNSATLWFTASSVDRPAEHTKASRGTSSGVRRMRTPRFQIHSATCRPSRVRTIRRASASLGITNAS